MSFVCHVLYPIQYIHSAIRVPLECGSRCMGGYSEPRPVTNSRESRILPSGQFSNTEFVFKPTRSMQSSVKWEYICIITNCDLWKFPHSLLGEQTIDSRLVHSKCSFLYTPGHRR
ncbi:hypothetical protein FGIG_09473 [Fasciola gigantica]|uniref:Uncharacterized protein n=1 Tax=Fasciola gigantica TaxID=46835 RepID=A0A504Z044_FASGI|nr:hypothetical protein FGIG_09473 [Fasciola gigantica]